MATTNEQLEALEAKREKHLNAASTADQSDPMGRALAKVSLKRAEECEAEIDALLAAQKAPAKQPTYTVSQFHSNGVFRDTEYTFSDGEMFKVYEATDEHPRRYVAQQDNPGNDLNRTSFDALKARMEVAVQDGETEVVRFETDAYKAVKDAEQAEIEAIDMDELDEFVQQLNAKHDGEK